MKKAFLVVMVFICFCIPTSVSAHPGRTDANGGHQVKATGEYHYHHGFEAHQHENGVCPYLNEAVPSNTYSDDEQNYNFGKVTSSSVDINDLWEEDTNGSSQKQNWRNEYVVDWFIVKDVVVYVLAFIGASFLISLIVFVLCNWQSSLEEKKGHQFSEFICSCLLVVFFFLFAVMILPLVIAKVYGKYQQKQTQLMKKETDKENRKNLIANNIERDKISNKERLSFMVEKKQALKDLQEELEQKYQTKIDTMCSTCNDSYKFYQGEHIDAPINETQTEPAYVYFTKSGNVIHQRKDCLKLAGSHNILSAEIDCNKIKNKKKCSSCW